MSSLVAAQLSCPPCGRVAVTSAATTKSHSVVVAKVEVQRRDSSIQLQSDAASSSRIIERRQMMKMMLVSGAAFLSLGMAADASHAAAGELEGPEQVATNPLIQQLLERSRANKAVNDQQRLDDYYKRNFKEYFEFVEGSVRNKKELTAAEKAIVEWLAKNK